jgi:hypothetical protein
MKIFHLFLLALAFTVVVFGRDAAKKVPNDTPAFASDSSAY